MNFVRCREEKDFCPLGKEQSELGVTVPHQCVHRNTRKNNVSYVDQYQPALFLCYVNFVNLENGKMATEGSAATWSDLEASGRWGEAMCIRRYAFGWRHRFLEG